MIFIIVFIIAQILCGYMAYGITFSMYWNEFPSLREKPGRVLEIRRRSVNMAMFGMSGLIAALLVYGWKYAFNPIWRWK